MSVGAYNLITKDIEEPGDYVGIMPAQSHKNWAKSSVFIKKQGNKLENWQRRYKKYLPHREPFLFLDEVIEINEKRDTCKKICAGR